ncbi:hypothetical protein CPB85DRAFT_1214125 [Mucidula mucida]|nr:hypothetical protein CPB85DRAFT_1214125 [Mucidula mucida]
MLRQRSRKFVKQALWWSRIKLVYARITLNRFTTLYFGVAVISCIVLSSLQAVAYHDNSEASDLISVVLSKSNITSGLTFFNNNAFSFCNDIPNQAGAHCEEIRLGNSTFFDINAAVVGVRVDVYCRPSLIDQKSQRALSAVPVFDASGTTIAVQINTGEVLPIPCLESLLYIRDILRDARREDVVTLLFQIWMLSLSLVTILNESLPHLGASLAGHVLGTAWAGFRVSNSKMLQERYNNLIVNGTCDGIDLLGNWWDIRTQHTIPVIAIHVAALLIYLYLSTNIYKVYANQSFSRVGASAEINNIYKAVLLLSVFLQLVGFFSLASTGMWIDKIANSSIRPMARHLPLYLAAFAVTAVIEIPWVVLGWLSVRREYRKLFVVFGILSVFLLSVSSFMFASNLYRLIFDSWPFFATITVTAYVLLVVTSFLAVVCRLHFGKGLKEYLRVTEALEGMDFTPVNFSKNDDAKSVTLKRSFSDKSYASSTSKEKYDVETLPYVDAPRQPAPSHQGASVRGMHSLSIYSDAARPTMKFSTTPPVARSIMSKKSSRFSSSTTSTGITTSSAASSVPPSPSLQQGAWRKEVPPVPVITVKRTASQVSRKPVPPLLAPASSSESSPTASSPVRGLPTNPRPGSPVNIKVQRVQQQQPKEGYF